MVDAVTLCLDHHQERSFTRNILCVPTMCCARSHTLSTGKHGHKKGRVGLAQCLGLGYNKTTNKTIRPLGQLVSVWEAEGYCMVVLTLPVWVVMGALVGATNKTFTGDFVIV